MGTIGYLLDTHTFLWAVSEDKRLSSSARTIIEDSEINLFVSVVTAYEIMNKYRIGKLPGYAYVAENYASILENFNAIELSMNMKHAHYAGEFSWTHRDPFDRLLAAQSHIEDLTLITNDQVFDTLSWVTTLW